MEVPKDFSAREIFKGKGTNGQTDDVWQVHGIGNIRKEKNYNGWSAMGWEFESESEAKEFYDRYKKTTAQTVA